MANIMISYWKILIAGILLFNFLVLLNYAPVVQKEEPVPELEDWKFTNPWSQYLAILTLEESHQGIKNDENYCKKVKQYQESQNIEFDDRGVPTRQHRVIFSDYTPSLLAKKILSQYAQIKHRNHTVGLKYHTSVDLDPSINSFFHLLPNWHIYHKIDTHFLCEGQRYNHIPGNAWLNFKDVTANAMRKYGLYYKDRKECFDPWTVMPYTLDLTIEKNCKEFERHLETAMDSKSIQWMLKVSRFSHNGKGITLVDQQKARELYENFTCPYTERILAQEYIQNPLLIDNKKFDFRVYLLIASMEPLLILYHDGFVKVSIEDYDPETADLTAHLTNTKVAEDKVNSLNVTSEMRSELLKDQGWSFKHYEDYMKQHYGVGDQWMTGIRTYIKQVMFHMVRMNIGKLLRHPGVYEIFGLDFIMDSDLKLWFIETNLTPSLADTTKEKRDVNVKLVNNMMDIEYALQYEGDVDRIVDESDFEWVYDERRDGSDQYFDLITPDCI